MKNKMLPPPGGIILIVVPTLQDWVASSMADRYTQFTWLEWADLDLLTTDGACAELPPGCTAIVYSGMFHNGRESVTEQVLKSAGVAVVWFEKSLEGTLALANTLAGNTTTDDQPRAIDLGSSVVEDSVDQDQGIVLLAGFASDDFPEWRNHRRLRWWTIQQAEQQGVEREIREHKVRFVILNQVLSGFHLARHMEAARRYLSDENIVRASDIGEVDGWLKEMFSEDAVVKEGSDDMEEAIRLEEGKKVVVAVPDSRDFQRYAAGPHGSRIVVMDIPRLRTLLEAPDQGWPSNVQALIISRKISFSTLRDRTEAIAKANQVTDIRLVRSSNGIHEIIQATLRGIQPSGSGNSQIAQKSFCPQELSIPAGGKIGVFGINAVSIYEAGTGDLHKFLNLDRSQAQHLQVIPLEVRVMIMLNSLWEMPTIVQRFRSQAAARSIAIVGDETWQVPQLKGWLGKVKINWGSEQPVAAVSAPAETFDQEEPEVEADLEEVEDFAEEETVEQVEATTGAETEIETLVDEPVGALEEVLAANLHSGRSNEILKGSGDLTQLFAKHLGVRSSQTAAAPGAPSGVSLVEQFARQLEEKNQQLQQAQERIRRLQVANLRLLKEKNALAAQLETATTKQ